MRQWLKRWTCRSAAVALLALHGCVPALVNNGRIKLSQAEQLYTNVQELRQLNFKNQIPIVVEQRGQAASAFRRELTRRFGPLGLRVNPKPGMLTGLYAPGTDLDAQIIRMADANPTGFYDQHRMQLVLIDRGMRSGWWARLKGLFAHGNPADEMLFAHELTRALQDQYFGLDARHNGLADNDDRALALSAVAEGDSALVGYGYGDGVIDDQTVQKLPAHAQDVPRLFDLESPDISRAVRDPLIFSYTEGPRFVAEVYKHGGWEAVNALYNAPALSTRQVLDPPLYFDHSPPPPPIKIHGWARVLKGWRETGEDTYGELLIRVILSSHWDGNIARDLARGWRSDRMVVLQSSAATSIIWAIVMDTQVQAAAFVRAYERILQSTAPGDHHLEWRGSAVLAIIGPAAVQSAELVPAVWRESRIGVATY
jgi:hypothetical protein